ncbi:MAG: DUF4465 domain-containing protein [Bacteroidales bacterium]|jgi:parallel beta-helix repeat protein|nr:DUF4465 domain-containing protein [Bacteroidales bacterium]
MKIFRLFTFVVALFAITLSAQAGNAKLSGSYIIGSSSSADYNTFAAAMTALQAGIEAPVIFKVESGTYPERIVVPDVDGTSAINTILFTSVSGNNNDAIIAGTAYGGSGVAIFKVNGTDYVTVENLSFIPTSQSNQYNVHITNMSRHFTLRNCILTANMSTDIYGMRHVYTEAANVENQNNDFITVENCTITGGYIGLYIGGTSYVALPKQEGAVLRNNILSEQGSKGIYIFDEKDALIENNTIVSSSTTKSDYQSIDIFRGIGNMIVRNNKINISQPVYSKGIFIRTDAAGTEETPLLVYNNSISMINSPSASSYGICMKSDCRHISFYYNSINIEGNGGYCFGVTDNYSDITDITFQNNLLQNKTPSPVFFFRNQQHYEVFTLKNNAYYFTGNKFTNNWGDDFATWEINSGEQNSFIEQAAFNSSTDLHLQQAGNLRVALPVSYITTDLDGQNRHAVTPTIGAYEFEDSTPAVPQMEAGYPQLISCTYNEAQFKVKVNQAGTLYYLLRSSSNTPTISEVLASSTSINVSQSTESVVTLSELTPQQTYYLYFVAKSIHGMTSELITCDPFTTLQQTTPLAVTLNAQYGPIDFGASITITPVVSGGATPYAYNWKNGEGSTIGNNNALTIQPERTDIYYFTVTDAQNSSITKETTVLVNSEEEVATFDDLELAPESYWNGADTGEMNNLIYSGTYSFTNTYMEDYNAWGGFAYSNITETTFDPGQILTHQFRSVVGSGANDSENFAVIFSLGFQTDFNLLHNENGDIVPGVFVTNSAYTHNSILNGDGYMGTPFEEGDYYKVIFTATNANNETVTVEYYLADYRSSNSIDHYSITEWQWVDLSSLGTVKKVKVSVDGSRKNAGGLTIPAYLCMDEIGNPMPVYAEEDWNIIIGEENTLSLQNMFPFTGTASVTYSILSISNDNISAKIEDNKLKATTDSEVQNAIILISGTQKGITKYIRIKVSTSEELPLEINIDEFYGPVPAGTSVTLTPDVRGGVKPYSFVWKNNQGETLGTDASLTVKAESSTAYYIMVTDAEETSIAAVAAILVDSEHETATFDDLPLASESAWNGSLTGATHNIFFSGSYMFSNMYNAEYDYWSGFAYSNMTATDFDPDQYLTHQFRSAAGSGANESKNYAVVYPQASFRIMHNLDEGDIIQGVYVTHAAYAQHSILNGDNFMGDPFGKDDFYKIIFSAENSFGETNSIEYYLADYRAENEKDHYSIAEWQWIDLSSLGKVKNISISVDASRQNEWGITVPAYLCVDEIGSIMPFHAEKDWNISVAMENTLTLSELFSFTEDATVAYKILETSSGIISASIEGEILKVTVLQDIDHEIMIVSATQKGITKYVRLTVSTTNSIAQFSEDNLKIYPVPATKSLHIQYDIENYQIRIYDITGRMIIEKQSSRDTQLNIECLQSGVYIIEIAADRQQSIKRRFIKQ